MKKKIWLVLLFCLFVVGCSTNNDDQQSISGEYINSNKNVTIVYEKKALENYFNMSEKEKQEKIKHLITDYRYIDGVKEILIDTSIHEINKINITDSEFSGEWSNGKSLQSVKLEDKFYEPEAENVYKVKTIVSLEPERDTENIKNGMYYVFDGGKVYQVAEHENYISIYPFYSSESDEYKSFVKSQESIEREITELGLKGNYVRVGEGGVGILLEGTDLKDIIQDGDIEEIFPTIEEVLSDESKKYNKLEITVTTDLKGINIGDNERIRITTDKKKNTSISASIVNNNDFRVYDIRKSFGGLIVHNKNKLYRVAISDSQQYLVITEYYKNDSEEHKQALKLQEEKEKAESESIEKAKAESESIEKAKAESESIAREKAESESRAEAERQKAEAERKKSFTPENYPILDYESAMRNEDDWLIQQVQISGKVLQVISNDDTIAYRIGTLDSGYDGVFYVEIPKSDLENRILEDDWVTVYGVYYGVGEYTTVLNVTKEIPEILARKITVN